MEIKMTSVELSIVAEIELIYRHHVKPSQRPHIKKAKDAYRCLMITWNEHKIEFVEQFKVMLLNRNSRVLGIVEISTGGTAGTVIDPKLIFSAAIK